MLGKKLGKSEQPWPLAPYNNCVVITGSSTMHNAPVFRIRDAMRMEVWPMPVELVSSQFKNGVNIRERKI